MSFLTHFSTEIITITWHASLLIALLLVLRPILARWLPPAVLPWLWVVVAIKLLLISAPGAWWSPYNYINSTAWQHVFRVTPTQIRLEPTPVTTRIDVPELALSRAFDSIPAVAPASPTQPPSVSISKKPWNWTALGGFIWLQGVALLALWQIGANALFNHRLVREKKSAGSRWQALLDECVKQVGLKTSPRLIETSLVGSPSVMGLFRSRLLVPPGLLDRLEPEEVRLVFLHELSHLHRRDLWLLSLFAITRIVHWFNPLVWLAERALRADCEAACDAAVLRLVSDVPQHYAHTLLRLTQLTSSENDISVLVAAISTNSNQTERRLHMIMRYRKPAGWRSIAAFVIVVITATLILPNEVNASAGNQQDQQLQQQVQQLQEQMQQLQQQNQKLQQQVLQLQPLQHLADVLKQPKSEGQKGTEPIIQTDTQPFIETFTPIEIQSNQVAKARDQVLADNPTLKKENDALLNISDKMFVEASGDNKKALEDHAEKMKAAMVKIDPTLASIFAKQMPDKERQSYYTSVVLIKSPPEETPAKNKAPMATAADAKAPSLQGQYLHVYLKMNDAENLEKQGHNQAALDEYKDCYDSYTKIHQENPNWEQALVNHRMADCKAKVADLQSKIKASDNHQ